MNEAALRTVLSLAGTLILMAVAGCGDEDPVALCADPGGETVTVRIEERDSCEGCELVVLFTSSLDGTVHDHFVRTDESEVELEIPPSSGDGFFVSHIVWITNSPTTSIRTTYHPAGSDHEVRRELGYGSCSGPWMDLEFTNIPEHDGYILSAWPCVLGKSDLLADQRQISVYREPLDLLLTVDPVDAPRSYMWLDQLAGSSTRVFDLDELVPFAAQEVDLPSIEQNLWVQVWGTPVEEIADPGYAHVLLDERLDQPIPAVLALETAAPDFAGYKVRMQTSVPSPYTRILVTETEGSLPGSVSFWNPEIEILEASPDSFMVDVDASADLVTVTWDLADLLQDEGKQVIWEIDVPNPSRAMALPELPDFVTVIHPHLVHDDYDIWSVAAERYSQGQAADGSTMEIVHKSSLFGFPDFSR